VVNGSKGEKTDDIDPTITIIIIIIIIICYNHHQNNFTLPSP